MMPQDSQEFESYVPVYDTVPETWEDARQFLVEQLKKISEAVNAREIGFFLDEELLSGKQFIPGTGNSGESNQYRSVLRKVVTIGPLIVTGLNQRPHGITIDSNFTLISLWVTLTNSTALTSFQATLGSPTLNESVKVDLDSTNINITTGIDYSAYDRVYAFIEYIQEL